MDQKIILVTGANGQLGKCLQDIAADYPAIQFVFTSRAELPIEDKQAVQTIVNELKPFALINAAAYTAVDKAEQEMELAYQMNATAAADMAIICQANHTRFLHVSTDYVFDGEGTRPYLETDAVDPVNTYGASKQKGEQLILEANPEAIIVRTSWVYCRHGNNFVKTMLRLMKERSSISVVSDQIGCPTYAIDLAAALVTMALATENKPGIYHFSNSGPISWYEFAVAIKELSHLDCEVNAIPSSSYPTPAKRPHYSVMSNEKIQQQFSIVQKDWKQRLEDCLGLMQ